MTDVIVSTHHNFRRTMLTLMWKMMIFTMLVTNKTLEFLNVSMIVPIVDTQTIVDIRT